jgi:competence protein ComEC
VLAWFAAAWIAGIAASATFGDGAWPLAVALAASLLALAVVRGERWLALMALALPAVFVLAIAREHNARASMRDDAVAHYNDGVAMRLRAVVRDDPEIGDTSQRFPVSVRSIQRDAAWERASGGVLVRVPLLPKYSAGDIVELEGEVASPPRVDGFDYADYLARRGIGSVMEYPQVTLAGHDDIGVIDSIVLPVRRELSRWLALALPEPHASLAKGVLLGERSALPPDVRDDLNASNTSHLVVVSGANVVLVSSFCALLFGWLLGRRNALMLSIAAVTGYALLVGASPPVIRATIMGILLVIASVHGRRTSAVTSLMFAAALMALFDPSILRDVSFQLSFAATVGIAYLASPLGAWAVDALGGLLRRDELPRIVGYALVEPFAVTVAAVIATAPLIAANFGRVSLVALPANLLVVPLFPFILAASALAAIGGALPWTHVALGAPAYVLLELWLSVASTIASLPGATASLPPYTRGWLLLTYAGMIALLPLAHRLLQTPGFTQLAPPRGWTSRRAARTALFVAPAFVLAASVGWVRWPDDPHRLQVTVLDVDQGDAILIETPSGRDVLVDAGPGRAVLRGLGDSLPYHDRSVDLLVLTHPQADHATGALDVFERYDVDRVLTGAALTGSLVERALFDAARREPARIDVVAAGASFEFGDGVRIDLLSPVAGESAATEASNNDSLVLRVSYGEVSFLLTGDIEAIAEESLLERGVDLRATVLKVAHHGSATSSTRAFLDAVAPAVSVVSSGRENAFGHPDAAVMARLDDYGEVYVTADDGAVRFETDGLRLWMDGGR